MATPELPYYLLILIALHTSWAPTTLSLSCFRAHNGIFTYGTPIFGIEMHASDESNQSFAFSMLSRSFFHFLCLLIYDDSRNRLLTFGSFFLSFSLLAACCCLALFLTLSYGASARSSTERLLSKSHLEFSISKLQQKICLSDFEWAFMQFLHNIRHENVHKVRASICGNILHGWLNISQPKGTPNIHTAE